MSYLLSGEIEKLPFNPNNYTNIYNPEILVEDLRQIPDYNDYGSVIRM